MAPRKDGSSAGEDCLVWSSKSPHLLGRGTLFKDGQSPSALLQEDSAPCDSDLAVLCIHLTQPL